MYIYVYMLYIYTYNKLSKVGSQNVLQVWTCLALGAELVRALANFPRGGRGFECRPSQTSDIQMLYLSQLNLARDILGYGKD